MPRRRIWADKRDAKLIAFYRSGDSYTTIARRMRISLNAAAARVAVLICLGVLDARHGKWARGVGSGKTSVKTFTRLGTGHTEPTGRDVVQELPELTT